MKNTLASTYSTSNFFEMVPDTISDEEFRQQMNIMHTTKDTKEERAAMDKVCHRLRDEFAKCSMEALNYNKEISRLSAMSKTGKEQRIEKFLLNEIFIPLMNEREITQLYNSKKTPVMVD